MDHMDFGDLVKGCGLITVCSCRVVCMRGCVLGIKSYRFW
jgi:hypothetical protein